MVVAIAGDNKRREYWFGNEARSIYARQTFLLLLFPGFVSLSGLIPPFTDKSIPAWPFPAIFFGMIYFCLSIYSLFQIKKLKYPLEYKRLVKGYSNVNLETIIISVITILLGIFAYFSYYSKEEGQYRVFEILLSIVLGSSIVGVALASITFLKSDYGVDLKNNNQDENISKCECNEISMISNLNPGVFIISSFVIAMLSFALGLMIGAIKDRS